VERMYAFIEGIIEEVRPSHLVIQNQGIGYLIISPNPYSYHIGESVKIYTHHYVREDLDNLYGFRSRESKDLFIRLIGVSGIGPKSALLGPIPETPMSLMNKSLLSRLLKP